MWKDFTVFVLSLLRSRWSVFVDTHSHPSSISCWFWICYENILLKPIVLGDWVTGNATRVLSSVYVENNNKKIIPLWCSVKGRQEMNQRGKPFSVPKGTSIHLPLCCLLRFLLFLPLHHLSSPIRFTIASCQKKNRMKRCRYHGGRWSEVQPWVGQKHARVWGFHCNVRQFISIPLFFPVSDIPWDSSLSSQALALFLSRFI